MKRLLMILLTLALAVGTLVPAVALAIAPAPTCVEVDTQICVGNLPDGGVEGGNNNFCSMNQDGSPNYEEWDEWHFIINQVSPATEEGAPAEITVTFAIAGNVVVDLEGINGSAASYRIKGEYLDDTLLSACGILPAWSCYGNFVLSHAPCESTTTTTTTETSATTSEITEVGGTILPTSKGWMIAPLIALAAAFITVSAVMIWRRQAVK